jgi:signal transduction histidine kinase
MLFTVNRLLCIKILIFPIFLFSQTNTAVSSFKKAISQDILQVESSDYASKISAFFTNEQPDSILVYTTKAFNEATPNTKLTDYYNFLRGYSFYKKRILNKAEEALLKVSQNFKYYHTVIAFLGTVTLESSQFKKALNYFKKIEKLPESALLIINSDKVKDNIGVCHLHLENYEEAERYLTESLKYIRTLNDTVRLITAYGNLANLNYVQYKDDKAIPLFQKAYNLATTTDDFTSKQNTALNMAIVEENRKDLTKALAYRKEYERWKDSINNQNRIYATVENEKKVAVEKKEKELAILTADNKVKIAQRNTYLYSAIILLVMFGVSLYLYREKVKRNKIIQQQKEDLDALNNTKDKLFSIVSHDLRSSVHAIKTSNKKLISKLETEKSTEVNNLLQNNSSIVNNAYTLLDNLLNWALLQTKQTHFEITTLRLYTIVEHVAYNYTAILADKEITFKNVIPKSENVLADRESLKIILRNVLDNAIKFSNEGDAITMYTKNNDTEFCKLIVEDTGIGMDESTRLALLKETSLLAKKQHENSIGTGLGMQLCKSMMKKNNGTFSIESELGKGTKIILSLPKK